MTSSRARIAPEIRQSRYKWNPGKSVPPLSGIRGGAS
jgi:hypothetical protein